MSEKDELRKKRRQFCCLYAALGDPVTAAVQAGFSRDEALAAAMELLRSPVSRKSIKEHRKLLDGSGSVLAGLRRLAFGSCNDAVRLAFSDELPPQDVLDRLDLYNVSEIKRVRGGGVEVKVFDRIKALEKLCELERAESESDRAEALIKALTSHGEEDEPDAD
ncbi:MAG: terminase small subunit [Ruminococcus sp.]|nr:terminase small subunit [Ruminococcus sp.]